MLKNSYHTHCQLCRHASGMPSEYIAKAVELGMNEIGISDHAHVLEEFLSEEAYQRYGLFRYMTLDEFETAPITEHVTSMSNDPIEEGTNAVIDVEKFISDVAGTAKLVRSKGVIKIVARRGKSTYNQTTPNSVCINDFTKNEFFKNCREIHGQGSAIFQFKATDGRPYDYWNDIIDKEYVRQKNKYLKGINK